MTKRTLRRLPAAARTLANERGASLVLALVLVMVCAVIATLIVGTAATGTERTRQHAQEERAYYAVTSTVDQAAELFRSCAPAVRLSRESLDTDDVRYTTSHLKGDGSWQSELETWCVLATTGQTSAPFTFTASMFNEAFGQQAAEGLPTVEVSYRMNPATYKVTVTARQAEQDSDYANVLEKSIAKNASSSSETTSEIHVAWNGKTAPSLKHAAEGAAPAPEEGKVSKKLASIYKAWQAKGFDWSSVSWKQLTDDRGTSYYAARYVSNGRVALVWFDGTYYKATFDGADYPTDVDNFDVRDHLLGKHPFYNGERSEKGPVSIMWQEVSTP